MSDAGPRSAAGVLRHGLTVVSVLAALIPGLLALVSLLGLGMHRHGPPWLFAPAAVLLVFAPPTVAAAMSRTHKGLWWSLFLGLWATGVFMGLPLYFPGERNQAVVTGLSLGRFGGSWEGMARAVADRLPEPEMADPEVPEATTLVDQVDLEPLVLAENQIALPYEGEGRRMSVPVTFEQDGIVLDNVWMMLDTGATYTTLPDEVLGKLGIHASEKDPEIHLHTANGERTARVVLLKRIWLGNLSLDGVAIAVCDGCSSSDTAGLLGLNVTSGFNLNIDADRREVVFTSRNELNRSLDVKPFADIGASVSRYAGGRVEVEVRLRNDSARSITTASAGVSCGNQEWLVQLDQIGSGETATQRRRLPAHDPCERYQVGLHGATW